MDFDLFKLFGMQNVSCSSQRENIVLISSTLVSRVECNNCIRSWLVPLSSLLLPIFTFLQQPLR